MATWHLIWPFGLAFSQASLSALMEWSNAAFEQRKAFSTHLLLPASSRWFFLLLQTGIVSVFSNHLDATLCASPPAYDRWPPVFPCPAVSSSLWPCSQNRLQVLSCSQTGFSLQPPLSTTVDAWYVGKPVPPVLDCQCQCFIVTKVSLTYPTNVFVIRNITFMQSQILKYKAASLHSSRLVRR